MGLLVALALTGLAAHSAHNVVPTPFDRGLRISDIVVRGRIVRVESLEFSPPCEELFAGRLRYFDVGDRLAVAEIEVERVLKGDVGGRSVTYLAQPPWEAEQNSARVGDGGWFFFAHCDDRDAMRDWTRGGFATQFGDRRLLSLVWAGNGALLDFERGGSVQVDAQFVSKLPNGLEVMKAGGRKLVEHPALEAHLIATIERQRRPLLTLECLWSEAPGAPWKLDLARNGEIAITGTGFESPFRSKTYDLESFGDYIKAGAPPGVGYAIFVQGEVRCELRLTLHSSQGPHAYDLSVERNVKPLSADEAGVAMVWLGLKKALTSFDAPQAVHDVLPQRN